MTRLPEDRSLELSGDALRDLVAAATERLVAHVASLPKQPAADTAGGAELARSLRTELPETGRPAEELLDLVFSRVIPKSFNTAGPGYLAYIPGGGLPHAAVADLISGITNRYVGVFAAAPGVAAIEADVVRWFCAMAGLPPDAGGVLTSGGSLSNFSALVAARRRLLPENFLDGTIYVSDQAHYSVAKAAMLAGFPERNVRKIATDAAFRIRADAIGEAIARDRAAGKRPFLLVGNAGTTNTGAVDDLDGLAGIARREGLWYHVDAAYGGFFVLTSAAGERSPESSAPTPSRSIRTRASFSPTVPARSSCGTWPPCARRMPSPRTTCRRCRTTPTARTSASSRPSSRAAGAGCACGSRSRCTGSAPSAGTSTRSSISRVRAAEELRRIPGVEIVAEPQLSIVAFRLRRSGLDEKALTALNRDLLARVNARARVHLTSTMLGDRFAIRICVLSFRTHADRMGKAIQDIRVAAISS